MQTTREQIRKTVSTADFRPSLTPAQALVSENPEKRVKMNEYKSWSVCFSVIVLLTGLLKVLKLGVTMETLNSLLFYGSLGALAFMIYRVRSLSKGATPFKIKGQHDLN